MLEEFEKGQFARFKANPNYWGGKPAVDRVVLRKFNNPDAMVAALKTGELDAAYDIPSSSFNQLKEDDNLVTVEGYQGAFSEVAINGGDGLKKPHPALADLQGAPGDRPRDRQETIVTACSRASRRRCRRSSSPDPKWTPDLGEASFKFDLDEANRSSTRPATRTRTATACARCPVAVNHSTSPTTPARTARPVRRSPSSCAAG